MVQWDTFLSSCVIWCVAIISPLCFQVPVVSGECVLNVEGLEPNQKYVFAVAAYNSQAKLLGNTIGGSTFPLLASLPVPLLSAWAHLAQVLVCHLNTRTLTHTSPCWDFAC